MFKRLKQNIPLNYFLGDNQNAIEIKNMVWARNSVANASDTALDQMHIGIFQYGISDTLPFNDLNRSIQIPLKSQKI
jgi:hypothetical protein